MKHLPDILTLQKDLVKKFQNITEMTCDTIAGFLQSQKSGIEAHCVHQWFSAFQLYDSLTQEIESSLQPLITVPLSRK